MSSAVIEVPSSPERVGSTSPRRFVPRRCWTRISGKQYRPLLLRQTIKLFELPVKAPKASAKRRLWRKGFSATVQMAKQPSRAFFRFCAEEQAYLEARLYQVKRQIRLDAGIESIRGFSISTRGDIVDFVRDGRCRCGLITSFIQELRVEFLRTPGVQTN